MVTATGDAKASQLCVGLIGYGYAGKTFHAPLVSATEGFALKAVASSRTSDVLNDHPGASVDDEPMRVIARDDIDLIVIATPNDTHAPLARLAIEAGKHVVIDKPFALDMDEARSLIAFAAEKGVLLSVFHNRRWDSDFLTVRDALRSGVIGEARHFESHFDRFRPVVRDRWRERAGRGAGVWFDLGPHLADQALLLFGLPDRIQADLARQRSGAMADDWAHAILHYGEARVILHAGMLVAGGSPRFIIHGERGTMLKRFSDCQEAQLLAGMAPGASGWGVDDDALIVFNAEGHEQFFPAKPGDQRLFYAGVRDAILGRGPNPVSPIEALAVMAIIEAGATSAREQAAVPLALSDDEILRWRSLDRSEPQRA
jgi:predicted dehydrogenase